MIEKENPERKKLVDDVLALVSEKKIKYAQLEFTDIHGILKSVNIHTNRLEDALVHGQNFDGSSITGYGSIEESDMVVLPDPSTFVVLPGRDVKDKKTVCRLLSDIYNPDRSRYAGDPRFILQKQIAEAKKLGYEYMCSPELEFFLLREAEGGSKNPPVVSDMRGYFDYDPGGEDERVRREIADTAEYFGIEIEMLHHEVAVSQHEVDIKYGSVNTQADTAVTMKVLIKIVAASHNKIATFMPKPFYGVNGSGMHVHQSLWKGGKNAFYDANEPTNISDTMKHFIAGQLTHGREMCAVLASWPNSYKRLIPGYEAPVYIAWGFKNRSPLIRVPDFGGRPNAARCEIRCPDPSGNPYLQFAVLLAAGIDGIKKKTEAPPATDLNVYHLTYKDRKKMGIISLPGSLGEALNEFENSSLMLDVFDEHPFKNFLYAKQEENDFYRGTISNWEFDRYVRKL